MISFFKVAICQKINNIQNGPVTLLFPIFSKALQLYLLILFQNFMAQSKAMELDLENEIEKTKKEGILFVVLIFNSF